MTGGLAGEEDALRGNGERLLCQACDGCGGVAIAAFAGDFLIELQRLLKLAEFFLKDASAFQHRGEGFRAFGILADELGPLVDGLAVTGRDVLLLFFRVFKIERLGLVHGSEQIEDSRRAFVKRMGAQEGLETFHRKLLLLASQSVEAHLKLGVDDGVLAILPLGAVRIVLHIRLPGGDGFFMFLLLPENLPDAKQRAHLQVGKMRGGSGAEFLIHRSGGISIRKTETFRRHEIAVSSNGVIRAACGLQGFGDHPRGPHRTTARGMCGDVSAARLDGLIEIAVGESEQLRVRRGQAAGVADERTAVAANVVQNLDLADCISVQCDLSRREISPHREPADFLWELLAFIGVEFDGDGSRFVNRRADHLQQILQLHSCRSRIAGLVKRFGKAETGLRDVFAIRWWIDPRQARTA